MIRPDSGRGLPRVIPTVDQLIKTVCDGPWQTKSGSSLLVALRLPFTDMLEYMSADKTELDALPQDIRGFRICTNRNMPKGGIGGNEFHRIRKELFVILEGTLKITSEDLRGNTREEILQSGETFSMLPYIMHSVEALEEGTGFLETASTLFNVADPRTHDTYPREEFERLKLSLKK